MKSFGVVGVCLSGEEALVVVHHQPALSCLGFQGVGIRGSRAPYSCFWGFRVLVFGVQDVGIQRSERGVVDGGFCTVERGEALVVVHHQPAPSCLSCGVWVLSISLHFPGMWCLGFQDAEIWRSGYGV